MTVKLFIIYGKAITRYKYCATYMATKERMAQQQPQQRLLQLPLR